MFDVTVRMIDPAALALVAGGSLLVAGLRSTKADIVRSFAALRPLFRATPARDEVAARMAVRQVRALTELKGLSCADRVHAESLFVRRAALKLCDAPSAEAFSQWAQEELDGRAARHGAAAGFWRSAADTAPSMGMVGTVLGLIGMFAAMDDSARMGPAMALAMLTTLYGLVLGTIVFGAVAARLERLSEAELAWQKSALAEFEKLARAEAQTTEAWLKRRSKALQ